jgi:hypothetical protein
MVDMAFQSGYKNNLKYRHGIKYIQKEISNKFSVGP